MNTQRRVLTSVVTMLVLAANALAQGGDAAERQARIPVRVNVAATVSIEPSSPDLGQGAAKTVTANRWDTLIVTLAPATSVSREARRLAGAPVSVGHSRGNVSLALDPISYQNTIISLYAANGKRVMRGKARASAVSAGGTNISRGQIGAGVYFLSVKGTNGNSYTTKLAHAGGRLNVSVAYSGGRSSLNKETTAMADAVTWTIRATATATGYESHSKTFEPAEGINERHDITLYAETVGFEPEMLGVTPGRNTSELRFTWYSDNSTSNRTTRIRLYDDGGALVKDTAGRNDTASTTARWHKAELTGLVPGTSYKYAVSSNGTDWSRKYDIKTPSASSFKFAAIGDPQIDNDTSAAVSAQILAQWKKAAAAIAGHGASLIVNVGDVADNGKESEYKDFMSAPELRNIPTAVAMGNHDFSFNEIMNPIFIKHFNLPNSTPPSRYDFTWWNQANYWYHYNNVLFVVLNTGLLYPSDAAQAQKDVDRFDSLINAAKTASAGTYDWLVIQNHKSTRSLGPHSYPSTSIPENLRETALQFYKEDNLLEKVFDKHSVDLVIAGHDHVYVRSKPVKNDAVVADGQGTVYLTLLPAGSWKFYPLYKSPEGLDWVAKTHPASTNYNFTRKNGYTMFEVNGKNISAVVYDNDGGIVDEFGLSK